MADHQKHEPVETSLAKAVKEEQGKAEGKAHEVTHETKKTAHETKESAKDTFNRAKKGEMTEEEKKKFLATAGAVVAFVAAVAFGGYKYHQHRKTKKEELEEQAGTIKAKAKRFGNWFGSKASETKDVAADNLSKATEVIADKTGDAAHRLGDAAKGVKENHKVKSTASHVPHPHLPHVGRESESSLNRASEKSDSLVRSTYDKAADTAGAVKDKAQGAAGSIKGNVKGAASAVEDKARSLTHSSTGKDISKHAKHAKEEAKDAVYEEHHGFLGGIKGWLADRKDELDEAARIGRKEQEYVADRAHAHADHLVHKVKH